MLHGVDCPAEDDLLCDPGGVAFAEIFERDGLLPCYVVLVIRAEELVDGAEEIPRHLSYLCWNPFGYTDEIIKVYFDVG